MFELNYVCTFFMGGDSGDMTVETIEELFANTMARLRASSPVRTSKLVPRAASGEPIVFANSPSRTNSVINATESPPMNTRLELKIKEPNGRYRLATDPEIVGTAKEIIYEQLAASPTLSSAQVVIPYLKNHYYQAEYETFIVFFLNAQNGLLATEEMFRGDIDSASVYPRQVARAALQHNAAAVIFGHCHPAGNPTPSDADIRITERLKDALGLLDIRVLDHVVIAGSSAVSFAQRGLL